MADNGSAKFNTLIGVLAMAGMFFVPEVRSFFGLRQESEFERHVPQAPERTEEAAIERTKATSQFKPTTPQPVITPPESQLPQPVVIPEPTLPSHNLANPDKYRRIAAPADAVMPQTSPPKPKVVRTISDRRVYVDVEVWSEWVEIPEGNAVREISRPDGTSYVMRYDNGQTAVVRASESAFIADNVRKVQFMSAFRSGFYLDFKFIPHP